MSYSPPLPHLTLSSNQIPEIQKAFDLVTLLLDKAASGAAMSVDYELADGIYAKAKVGGWLFFWGQLCPSDAFQRL